MAFDKTTRNRLANFVGKARDLIANEFTQQFQSLYGISDDGAVTSFDKLGHLDDIGKATAALLRERIDYFIKTHPDERDGKKGAVIRLAREQAFTILNRLAAIRMAEKRDLIVESVGKGYQSKGFKVFEQVAGAGLGDTYHRYHRYIFCLFDELAVDLGILFDRRAPQGLLFPQETALQELFALLNAPDLDSLWAEDETIGWIYQYYNDPAERKKMRDESAAPRNSRELAVRNQFFTPRYVVEFLTDNTLGRIWYEMTQGKTRLKDQCRYLVRRPTEIFLKPDEAVPESTAKDDLSQEELLKQPVYIPFRLMKDPRLLLMLDPACGSMHFGLYAFDLYEVIYEEAWDLGVESLRQNYPAKEDFLREVPRLIIEHNIHGIDIDPRAVQIAGLSLWLRAQKSWQAQHVPADKRPRIMRSNIVCAEPMPGSPEMLKEFTATLHPPLLGQLVEKVFAQMQLAGEAGSLLKIEEDIAALVGEAKKLWSSPRKAEQTKFDLGMAEKPRQGEFPLDVSGISDESFWETAEERIYFALKEYAEKADSASYQRRLFADDAARGFAFIDLCRKRYDVVVMNPPFGDSTQQLVAFLEHSFPYANLDLAACFLDNGIRMSVECGIIGAITARSLYFLSSFERFRRNQLLKENSFVFFADLGAGVLDAFIDVALIVVEHKKPDANESICFGLKQVDEKAEALQGKISSLSANTQDISIHRSTFFLSLPSAAFSFWTSQGIALLLHPNNSLASAKVETCVGLQTDDDNRFLRLTWEISPENIGSKGGWCFLAKGGEYSKFWDDIHLMIDWSDDGAAVKQFVASLFGSASKHVQNERNYFRRGLTYPFRTAKGFNVRCMPENCIFTLQGMAIFAPEDDIPHLEFLLGLLNSHVILYLLRMLTSSDAYQVGYVRRLPCQIQNRHMVTNIRCLTRKAVNARRYLDQYDETTRSFFVSFAFSRSANGLNYAAAKAKEEVDSVITIMEESIVAINESVISGFALTREDANSVLASVSEPRQKFSFSEHSSITADFVAYSIGAAFGRWDIRYATGEFQTPELPDPFAPLPSCPPGMLQNAVGLPAEPKDVPADYPLRISWPGIMVDDENHPEDIVARVREALEVIWKNRADAIEQEACELLGVKNLRDYFRRPAGFFADHLKRYSKSRRQAPIYWPLSTANGTYTLWIYYHRLTDQTLHTILADFVDPKLKAVRTETSAPRESDNHRDRLEELLDLEKELSDFRAEIERVIKLPWKPNLNDGVIITASPLWKLFRLPKWQKDLKACWEKLEKGEYDWAHLAYSIWPKRIEDICKKDRSIAIAHNLEHLSEVTPSKPKAKRGKNKSKET